MLRAQDLLLALKIQASGAGSFAELGRALGISASQVHSAAKRAIASGLLREDHSVRSQALLEALVAVKYYLPVRLGGLERGIPTAYAAPPLSEVIGPGEDPNPVWPHPEGSVRGLSCEPLYKTAPDAALRDAALYEYLALVDTLRIGRAREVAMARAELERRLRAAP